MRPIRLCVSGFTAFRDHAEVDFAGADLFAFTGPTGSGKSSLVDAMAFALYGSIPRLDRRSVTPIVSLGRTEARVLLEFSVGGLTYRAVRVVRRTKAGASTKEARLEGPNGEVLAGNEKELTAEVERLLGLGFDQFTTCVVLPQNEFMRLLHDEPSKRQDLLVRLLDLGLYERMARLARGREQSASQQVEVARTLLDKLAFATPEALDEAADRARCLRGLRAEVQAAEPRLEALVAGEKEARVAADAAHTEAQLLAGIEVPEGIVGHAEALAAVRQQLEQAESNAEQLVAEATDAEAALAALPNRSSLEVVQRAHGRRGELLVQHEKGQSLLAERHQAVDQAAAVLELAEQAAADADERLEQAQWHHRAHDLATSLVQGQPCPVCRTPVVELPVVDDVGAIGDARAEKRSADTALKAARAAHDEAARRCTEIELKLDSISGQLAEIEATIAGQPDTATIERELVAIEAAAAVEHTARAAATAANRAAVAARKLMQQHESIDTVARRRFDEVRDRLAPLGPPPATRVDLAADWSSMADWAAVELPARLALAVEAEARASSVVGEHKELLIELAEKCAAARVDVARGADVRTAVVDALGAATAERSRIEAALSEAVAYRADVEAHGHRAEVARELARLLSANHFEKWVLDEALAGLVAGATELLRELSGGAYSLGLDERSNFSVVDHRNADEVRSARTLSGGETFLASLALALALADQVGSLAVGGSARLESIFLDEGFGALDADTLDTVAAAIEELGAAGRMVGLISHVAELAERVPVRFEVVKSPAGSTVTKVMA